MSDNWVIQNLENALSTWDSKLSEIWTLLTQNITEFKDGALWEIVLDIHWTLQSVTGSPAICNAFITLELAVILEYSGVSET